MIGTDAGVPLSVVMPVRNAMPHLDGAIRSIVEQSYTDFEFVIRDDASDDGSTQLLREWAARDPRIRLFEGNECLGPAGAANFVIAHSSGPIIARMDADDVSHPERLRRQIAIFETRPEVVLAGTLCIGLDHRGRKVRSHDRWRLSGSSPNIPFPHGSFMFRREACERIGGYRPECDFWEDHDFALRLAAQGAVAVIGDVLYDYRYNEYSSRLVAAQDRVERALDLMYRCMAQRRAEGDYEALLAARHSPAAKIKPRTFVALGSLRLWSGHSPAILTRLLRRGALGLDRRSIGSLVWALWASVSHRSLRLFLRAILAVRNFRTPRQFAGPGPFDWRPG